MNFSTLAFVFFGMTAFADPVPPYLIHSPRQAFFVVKSGKEVIGKTEYLWEPQRQTTSPDVGDSPKSKLNHSQKSTLYFFKETTNLLMKLYNKQQKVKTTTDVWVDEKLQTQRVKFNFETDGGLLFIEGERVGSALNLVVHQAGNRTVASLTLKEPAILSPLIRPFILSQGLPDKGKKTISFTLIELSAYALVPATADIEKIKEDEWKITLRYMNHSMTSLMTSRGDLLREDSDLAGLPIVVEPLNANAFQAKKLTGTKEDLVDRAKVSFPVLEKARTLKSLTVKVTGIDSSDFVLNRHRQKWERNLLTVNREDLPATSVSVDLLSKKENLKVYLNSENQIAVGDPLIQKTAQDIVGQEKDAWKRAKLVHRFVYESLKKTPTITVPNAVEVLKAKRGDCNEHAALYTALARAAGVPTRTVVGLVYSDRFYGTNGFYYHAWVEVFTGDTWTSIDPTWDQIPSDATHLGFVDGALEKQLVVTNLMGKIKLEFVKSE